MVRFLLFLFLILTSDSLFAVGDPKDLILLRSGLEKFSTEKNIYIYQDHSGNLTVDDVSKPEFENRFIRNTKENVSLGFSDSSVWIRMEIKKEDKDSGSWLLEIGYPALDLIEIYSKDGAGWTKKEYGDSFPFTKREYFYRTFIHKLIISEGETKTVFLRIKTTSALIIPLTIYSEQSFLKESNLSESYHFCIYGILAVMGVYNLFICFSFWSLSYFLYSLNTFFTLLALFILNGHGFQYLWPEMTWFQGWFPLFVGSLSAMLGIAFSSQFLNLRKSSVLSYRTVLLFQFLILFFAIAGIFSLPFAIPKSNAVRITASIVVFFIGIRSFHSGNKSARFFVIGWTFLIIGAVSIMLRFLGLFPNNFFTAHFYEISNVLELVLLSFALSDRYKLIQDENIRVEKERNESLEIKVLERTAELNKTLGLIKADLAMAKKIQVSTLPSNLHSLIDLKIAVNYDPMNEVGGDFYSVDELGNGRYRIFLADATGHGVQAALVTMAIKGIYDNIRNFELPVSDLLGIFNNEYIHKYVSLRACFTCILMEIDVKNQKYNYSSAGHPAGIFLHSDEMTLLKTTGTLMGALENVKYRLQEGTFEKNDKLFLFTDGIFEEFKNEIEFGEDRLQKIIFEKRNLSPEEILQNAVSELNKFLDGEPKQDDITILGIQL